jgi:hypothetical protein
MLSCMLTACANWVFEFNFCSVVTAVTGKDFHIKAHCGERDVKLFSAVAGLVSES